ncbi:MAG: HIT domain-containing protein [Thermoleophilia bacterium]|nr:HIT domain-containing protein [Thermoleophilia bacterium]
MVERLWAPWRLSYVTGAKPDGCVLCAPDATADDGDALVVWRGQCCRVMMNRFPYANGHIMVIPNRHVADLTELTDIESREAQMLISDALVVMRAAMNAEGFNVGLNLGEAAGAGIASHLHWHVVPRWAGDTNFMPVLADVTVMPQHLSTTHELLRDGFIAHAQAASETDTTEQELR